MLFKMTMVVAFVVSLAIAITAGCALIDKMIRRARTSKFNERLAFQNKLMRSTITDPKRRAAFDRVFGKK